MEYYSTMLEMLLLGLLGICLGCVLSICGFILIRRRIERLDKRHRRNKHDPDRPMDHYWS